MEVFTIVLITFLIGLLGFIYSFTRKPFDYLKKAGIPCASGFGVKNFLDLLRKPMHEIFIDHNKKYGRLFGSYQMSLPSLTVSDPDLLRDILVKDFQFFPNRRDFSADDPLLKCMISVLQDENWKRVRTIMSRAFTTGKIRKMSNIILDSAKHLRRNFTETIKSGEPVEVKRYFGTFTMDVIASCAFGTKIDSHNDPDNPFILKAQEIFKPGFSWRVLLFFGFPRLAKLLRISIFPTSTLLFFKDVTLKIIEERRKTGNVQNDFLQLMMDAADEMNEGDDPSKQDQGENGDYEQDVTNFGHEEVNKHVFKAKKYKGLSMNELIAQSVGFFVAGFEPIASILAFAAYQLALNPNYQETVIREIDEAIRQNDNELTYEGMQSMKYLDKVLWETLRIYPLAVVTDRVAAADYKLGETGVIIPKGTLITIPIYSIHHDPEFYPEPGKFDPTRFDQDEKALRNPYTYLPFGAGPRNCIAMRFALMELKLCLAYVLSQFRFKRSQRTKVPLEFRKCQPGLFPKELLLDVEKRADAVLKD